MKDPLRLLLVEDRTADAELMFRELRAAGFAFEVRRVETENDFLDALEIVPDLIISDYRLPLFNGLRAFEISKERAPDIPFVLVSGMIGEEMAVEAMKQGVSDYVLKDRLVRLGPAVAQALEQKRLRQEKRAVDEALEQLRRKYKLILDAVAEGIQVIDRDGNITFENPAAEKMLGWGHGELLGKPAHVTIHHSKLDGSVYQQDDCPIYRVFKDGQTHRILDEVFWRKDGSWFHVEYLSAPIRDQEDRIVGAAVVFRDTTAVRKAEAKLLEQARLLDLAQDAITVRDLSNRIRFWSRGAEKTYGWSAAEAVDRSIVELVQADPKAFAAAKNELLVRGEWHGEFTHRAKSGRALLVDSRWTLVRNEKGEPESVLAINSDITERKSLEEQFLRSQRIESIGTLASGVAHDLNNILTPILMSASLLHDDHLRDRAQVVSTIEKSAQRGADIVKQMLTFARGMEGERVLLQPRNLVREIAGLAREAFPKSIRFVEEMPDDLWPILGDSTQIHQVLLNLCVNARDAMPAGGVLALTAENIERGKIAAGPAGVATASPYVLLTVRDEGCGIPPQILEKIFDPFFTTKEVGKGTGLGLSTVVGIVKSHGGFVRVESEPGSGTVFKIFLPASPGGITGGGASQAGTAPPTGHSELILVVDDEPGIRAVTEAMLTRSGYRVLLAADGTEAISIYARAAGEISLVLTDVRMPHVDGLALVRALRKVNPALKVITSSGDDELGRVAELRELQVDGVLAKPYTRENLLTTLAGVLRGGSAVKKEAVKPPA